MLSDVASMATAVGVLIAAGALWMSREQAKSSFEQSFVDRYWSIDDDLLETRHRRGPDTNDELRMHALRYLRLSEDEFDLRGLGQISRSTWAIWHDAIDAYLRDEPDKELVEGFPAMQRCLDVGARHGAHRCPGVDMLPMWRRMLALPRDVQWEGERVQPSLHAQEDLAPQSNR